LLSVSELRVLLADKLGPLDWSVFVDGVVIEGILVVEFSCSFCVETVTDVLVLRGATVGFVNLPRCSLGTTFPQGDGRNARL